MKLKYLSTISFAIPEPFSFELTVHKPAGWHWATPAEIFESGAMWTGLRFGRRVFGLKMEASRRQVTVRVYGTSKAEEEILQNLKKELKQALGQDENLTSFYEFARREPVLDEVVRRRYGMRVGSPRDLFGRITLAICLQMAPLKRSRQMMDLLLAEFGTHLYFDGKKVTIWPSPQTIAGTEPLKLRQKAKLGYRAECLVSAAGYITKKGMTISDLDSLSDEEAHRAAMQIPGIGDYSAGIVLGRGAVPVDSWSVIILSELILGKSPSHGRADIPTLSRKINRRWGRWDWLAFAYIVNDLPYLAAKYNLSRIY